MRLMTLILGSAVLSGCLGTRVVEIDPADGADRYTLAEAAKYQSGEIVTAGDVIRFSRYELQVRRDTLRVETRRRRSNEQISIPLYDDALEVRLRFRGSLLGGVVGVVAGTGIGYLAAISGCSDCNDSIGGGFARLGMTAGGALLGAILGAFVGPKKTTIYRFRPDTPQQVSVVIGVGPSMAQDEGTR